MKQLAIGFTLCMCCAAFAGGPKPNLQLCPRGQRLVPLTVTGCVVINGQIVPTTPDYPYYEGAGSDGSTSAQGDCVTALYSTCDINKLVFDAFEPNNQSATGGFPDDPDGSCTGFLPAGSRWYFGPTAVNPHAINDMCVCPGANGAQATGADIAWNWGGGASRPMSIALLTGENFAAGDCATAPSGGYAGVILNYAPQAGGAGYFYSNIDLCGSALFWQMPTDGCGWYEMRIGSFVAPTFTYDVTPGTQVMLWGDKNQPISAGSCADDIQWDDDTPLNNIFLPNVECYNYSYGICPDPLGIMAAFRTVGGVACNPCDTNGDGTVNLGDIDPFVTLLNAGGHPTGCVGDTNGDGTINLGDIDPFVQCLNAP